MAVPKRKTSKARKRKRRTHYKLQRPNLDRCSNCGAAKVPHRVCDECGHYGDRRFVEVNE
jgi:large subunit ribosomal protein L32